ncbi:DMT family transporter [Acinetobacter sp.]|uniref:DMT family transporter n=1 Tax=Acinetobacter sp. TaxID=472 RepID=UPI0035B4D98D
MPSKLNLISTYALLVFIWATTPLAIVWSVTDLHSLWALALRFFIALPLAVILLLIVRAKFPVNAQSLHSYVAGAFSFIGSQIFTYLATAYLSSGIIALMFGLAPIITGLIGYFVFKIHLHRMQWLGMLIAVGGLGIICFSGSQQHVQPQGIALMLLSVFIYCASIFWVKKINAPLQPMAQATGSIIVSALFAACMLPFIWPYAPAEMPGMKSLIGLGYAVVMASLVAMFCYFKLVRNIKAATLSLTTVLTPMIAMAVGALLNGEKVTAMVIAGAAVLLLGLFVYFYQDIKASRALAHKVKAEE